MDASELVKAARIVLRDPVILDETILQELNWAAVDSCAIVRIPTLLADDTLTIEEGERETYMPPDFHHNLISAYSSTYSKDITVRSNRQTIDALHSKTKTGRIEDVAVEGELLVAGPIASADEEIDIKYYAKPPELVNDNDNLDEHIPHHIARDLLCGKVILRKLPETDNDPQYIVKMTQLWLGLYEAAERKLKALYPDAPKRRPIRHRKIRTF